MVNLIKFLILILTVTSVSHAKSVKNPGELAYRNSCKKRNYLPEGRVSAFCTCAVNRLKGEEFKYSDSVLAQLAIEPKILTDEEASAAFHSELQLNLDGIYENRFYAEDSCLKIEKNRTAAPMEDEE